MNRIRARCPVKVARNGRITDCSTMINKTDGMCADHWAHVPVALQLEFVAARLGTAKLTRPKWNKMLRAAETRTADSQRETVSAPTAQAALL